MEDFKFKKQYGQNFISDINLLKAIVNDAKILREDICLEIGPGQGTLTKQLCLAAKKVVSIEIDKTLEKYLVDVKSEFDNFSYIFADVMKLKIEEIESLLCNEKYKIVANIPYYITTPIIFKFLEESDKIESITLMVQKEVAERMCAKRKSENFGILSIMCDYYAECSISRIVKRNMFYPVPNVDSAVVNMVIRQGLDRAFSLKLYKLVQIGFSMRRKTLVNNLMQGYAKSREQCEDLLKNVSLDIKCRAEDLNLEDWKKLCDMI